MTVQHTPCESAPEDWFIEPDGKQYRDDPDLDPDEKREALIRRRQARQACHTDCPVRLQCLDVAIQVRPSHGTWGGYHSAELTRLFAELDRRRNRRS